MMRKLATIQEIIDLKPIEGRDKIELATVLGWHVIVKKDEYKIGDKCIYVEIDSVMPEKPEFEFLRNKKFHIKTMKMAGVISQGICFPLSILPNANEIHLIGEDVTDLLGVTKYDEYAGTEPVIETNQKKKYPNWLMRHKIIRDILLPKKKSYAFPSFIEKTDEIRIQTIPEVLNNKEPMIVTEKVDGCSMTCVLIKNKKWYQFKPTYEFRVYSRNCYIAPDMVTSYYWKVALKFKIEKFLKDIIGDYDWIAVQGEVLGEKIQNNPYKLKEYDFKVFNVINPKGRMGSIEANGLCDAHGVHFVPVLDTYYVLPDTVDELLEYATNKSVVNPDVLREGVVIRSWDGSKSFKAVSPEYLLKFNR